MCREDVLIAVTPKIAERELGVRSAAQMASERFCAEFDYHPRVQQSRAFVGVDGTLHEPEEGREFLLPFFVKVSTRSATDARYITGPDRTSASDPYRLSAPFDPLSEDLNSLQLADSSNPLDPGTFALLWGDMTFPSGGESPTASPATVSRSIQPGEYFSANDVPGAAVSDGAPLSVGRPR